MPSAVRLAGLNSAMHGEFTRMLLHAAWPEQPVQAGGPGERRATTTLAAAAALAAHGVPPELQVPGVQRVLRMVSEQAGPPPPDGLPKLSEELELLPKGPTYAFLRR